MVTVIELWRRIRCTVAGGTPIVKQGGAGVAQIVHTQLRHVGDFAQPMEHAVDVAWLEEAAVRW